MNLVDRLLAEVEEEYAFNRVLPLYMFAWSLAGLGGDRADPDFDSTCRDAYELFVARHPGLTLVSATWPIVLAHAEPLRDGSELVFDLAPEAPPSTTIQALVHPSELGGSNPRTHALEYLMSAYFHQDWDTDGGTVSDTVAAFLDERRDLVSSCADQIDVLLRRDLPEGGLAALLGEWGCEYFAGDTDEDYRTWLDEIRQQIRAALTSSAAS